MKKIILAIFTIMLTLAIFGCGKTQQTSSGGSSGGGGGGGGGTPQTFSISVVSDLLDGYTVSGLSVMGADDITVALLDLITGTTVNAVGKIENGKYSVDGLDATKTYEVRLKKGETTQSNLAAKPRFSDTEIVPVNASTTTFVGKVLEKKDDIKDALSAGNVAAGKVNELFAVAKDNQAKLVDYAEQLKNSKQNNLTVLAWDTKNINGDIDDWGSNYTVLFDARYPLSGNDNSPNNNDKNQYLKVKSLKVARDTENLYFLWEQDEAGFYTDYADYGANTVEYVVGTYIAGTGWDTDDNTRPPSYVETPVLAKVMMSNKEGSGNGFFDAEIWDEADPENNIHIDDKMQGKLSGDKKFLEIAVSINSIKENCEAYLKPEYDSAYTIGIKIFGNYEHDNNNYIGHNYSFISNMLFVKF
ncbi:MAG: hypothetical protein LBK68_03490 [Candidatus Margulisbacteria bacterium]|jgi:hypothetical protein|nr:hypothetical protein [Candidatus Margulisiibacteriota bacterium]